MGSSEGFIRKWRIAAQAKATAMSQPQAVCDPAADCDERERRHGLKDAVYGGTLLKLGRKFRPTNPLTEGEAWSSTNF